MDALSRGRLFVVLLTVGWSSMLEAAATHELEKARTTTLDSGMLHI